MERENVRGTRCAGSSSEAARILRFAASKNANILKKSKSGFNVGWILGECTHFGSESFFVECVMRRFSIFQLSADPLNAATVVATTEFVVDVIDNDGTLSDPDGDGGQQFDTTGLPGAINSANTQVFEFYTGTAGGQPVEFILLRFSAPPLMVLTGGTLAPGETITNVALQTFNAPPIDFKDISSFVCFCARTPILTKDGPRPAGELAVGDLVAVRSKGFHPIRWIAKRDVSHDELRQRPDLRPVRIRKGALGSGRPRADLLVSRQHRLLISSRIVERVVGESEALIAAVKLTALPDVFVDEDVETISYVHFMLDDHEIVDAAGVEAESLYLGPEARKTLTPEALAEIEAIFPELIGCAQPPTRYALPSGRLQKSIIRRHIKNNKPMVAA